MNGMKTNAPAVGMPPQPMFGAQKIPKRKPAAIELAQ
jgi:hypothetical protein